MKPMLDFFTKLGHTIAAREAGVPLRALPAILQFGSEMDQPDMMLLTCKQAAAKGCIVYESTGGTDTPVHQMLRKLATATELRPSHPVIRDIVLTAIGRVAEVPRVKLAEQMFQKGASVGSLLGAVGRAGVSLSPSLLKTLLLGTVTAGVGGGTLAWMANRHVNEDDANVEATRQRAAAYRRMRQDIEGQLAAKGITQ